MRRQRHHPATLRARDALDARSIAPRDLAHNGVGLRLAERTRCRATATCGLQRVAMLPQKGEPMPAAPIQAAFLKRIGAPDLAPATSPFDPGYDPATLESHLE